MPLPKPILDIIRRMEEAINFPPLLASGRPPWQNHPMVSYSDLTGAVTSLFERARKVAIITGFYIPGGEPPATETDGPPGALILAQGLKDLGIEASLVSDEYTLPTLKAGLKILDLTGGEVPLIRFPIEHADEDHFNRTTNEEISSPVSVRFVQEFFNGSFGRDLTHLIYIERVGPNHTLESFLAQPREGRPPIEEFQALLPPWIRNRCFNSRLEDITRFTGKTHFLIEFEKRLGLRVESIGVGDRGNEIGAGRIPWEVFNGNSITHREPVFCCRLKTDFFVSCGVSNWGGYALIAGLALAAGRLDVLADITPEKEGMVLDYLVRHGPAVDGITCKQDHSVDGFEFENYMKVIERVKEIALDGKTA